MEVPESEIRNLIAAWKEARGETLSFTKAERRVKDLAGKGCPLLGDCSKCGKLAACPALDD